MKKGKRETQFYIIFNNTRQASISMNTFNLQFKKEDEVTELKTKSEWGIKKRGVTEMKSYSKEVRVVFNRQGI